MAFHRLKWVRHTIYELHSMMAEMNHSFKSRTWGEGQTQLRCRLHTQDPGSNPRQPPNEKNIIKKKLSLAFGVQIGLSSKGKRTHPCGVSFVSFISSFKIININYFRELTVLFFILRTYELGVELT